MKMLLLTDDCSVNPDAVVGAETNMAGAGVDVYLDTGAVLRVVGTTLLAVHDRLEAFYRAQTAEFVQTLDGSVHPLR